MLLLNLHKITVSTVIKENDWHGFEVYTPVYSIEPACIGLPLIILVKDGNIRLSTPDEAFEYLDDIEDISEE